MLETHTKEALDERRNPDPSTRKRPLGDPGNHPQRPQRNDRKGKKMPNLMKNNRGQGLVEYILIVVLMSLLAVGAIRSLGRKTHNAFADAASALNNGTTAASSDGATAGRIQDGG